MAKTSREVLEAIKAGNRFTRKEVDELISDGRQFAEHAETWLERLKEIADLEIEIETDGLSDIRIPVDIMDKTKGYAYPFAAVAEAIEAIKGAAGLGVDVKHTLEAVKESWETFDEYASTWSDPDSDPEDKTEAKDEMIGIADELVTKLGDLDDYGIDLATDPNS